MHLIISPPNLKMNPSDSDEKVLVYTAPPPHGAFEDMRHARNFANKHRDGGRDSDEKTSATWTPSGSGSRIRVTIEKTDEPYKEALQQWQQHQRELKNLEPLLASPSDGPSKKRGKK